MGKVYCPFQYLLKCHILCIQAWFCRERCYQKCNRVFADNRITVSLRICSMVFVDRYPGLQRLPSSCHHHVNDTFLVGNTVCFRPFQHFIVSRNKLHATRISAKYIYALPHQKFLPQILHCCPVMEKGRWFSLSYFLCQICGGLKGR